MAGSRPTTPSPLTPTLLSASTSPSSGNQWTPPSMAPPSLHRLPVASLPLDNYKSAPVVPHLTAPHTTLLSSSLTPELAPTTHHQSPPLCRRSISGEGHPRHRHVPLSLLHPSRQPPASHSTCMPRFGGNAATLLAAPPRSTVDQATGMVHRPWTESTDYSIQK
jgi:hypothetical protein